MEESTIALRITFLHIKPRGLARLDRADSFGSTTPGLPTATFLGALRRKYQRGERVASTASNRRSIRRVLGAAAAWRFSQTEVDRVL
jgi:hypothetical protein